MLLLQGVSKSFVNTKKEEIAILDKIDIDIQSGEFITVFGPNGAGKSTLMNMISGLDYPSSGEIIWDRPDRKVSYLFQDYKASLLPWRTAYQNIALPLQWKGLKPKQVKSNIMLLVQKFQIDIDLKAYPYTLSGGQAQLISILRSLVIEPDLLLLDEPFSALDYLNSISLLIKLQDIWLKSSFTGIFISHNIDEAIFLGDRLMILSAKPTSIVDIIEINLPRPRQISFLSDPVFAKIKQKVIDSISLQQDIL
jgi:NitT/TauT family transport system ATP-binding protein